MIYGWVPAHVDYHPARVFCASDGGHPGWIVRRYQIVHVQVVEVRSPKIRKRPGGSFAWRVAEVIRCIVRDHIGHDSPARSIDRSDTEAAGRFHEVLLHPDCDHLLKEPSRRGTGIHGRVKS